ncbi:hypothetical protein J6590_102109 [Homalodisca vitripennis]|nr:hypothetical protein J6590_086855 [Homalodisca vitripennis]KAG8265125.1 hypothetical protein J6590_102109 [Homalodisca vitripennis]
MNHSTATHYAVACKSIPPLLLRDKLDALHTVTQESMECEEEVTTTLHYVTTGYCHTCQHVYDMMVRLCVL